MVRLEGRRLLDIGAIEDEQLRRRIADDEGEFVHGEPPVQRQQDRAHPAAGELQLEDVNAIGRQDRYPVAPPDPEAMPERQGCATDPVVEFPIGPAAVAVEIDGGELVGGSPAVAGNPVVMRNGRRAIG